MKAKTNVTVQDQDGNSSKPLLVAGSYKNVCDEKPENRKCYIVSNLTGQNYHIAFWDDDSMNFINQTGKLTKEFVMYIPLPLYACH